jgi:hypothetical protein
MHDNAYAHGLQVLNACVTPGCYILQEDNNTLVAYGVV